MCGPHNSAATKHHRCQVALTPLCSLPGPPVKLSAISGRGPSTMPFLTDRPSRGLSSPELSAAHLPKHPPAPCCCSGPQSRRCLRPRSAPLAFSRPGWVLRRVYVVLFRQRGAVRAHRVPFMAASALQMAERGRDGLSIRGGGIRPQQLLPRPLSVDEPGTHGILAFCRGPQRRPGMGNTWAPQVLGLLILDASGVWLTPAAKQTPLLLEASPSPTPSQSHSAGRFGRRALGTRFWPEGCAGTAPRPEPQDQDPKARSCG